MPLYEYIDSRTGESTEMFQPVQFRDCVPPHLHRVVTVPAVVQSKRHLREQHPLVEGVGKGLKDIEEKQGAGEIERVFGMSTRAIKRVWNNFKPDDQPKLREVPNE